MQASKILDSKEIKTTGVDISPGRFVDKIVDLEQDFSQISKILESSAYKTIICFNVLEHVYNPIKVLENLVNLLQKDGFLHISTPISWPIHAYPDDFWRPLPNFYKAFANKNNLTILDDRFKYLGFGKVYNFLGNDGRSGFPPPVHNKIKFIWGRFIHRIFCTYGREYLFPNHLAQALTLKKN